MIRKASNVFSKCSQKHSKKNPKDCADGIGEHPCGDGIGVPTGGPPNYRAEKEMSRDSDDWFLIFSMNSRFYITGSWLFPGVVVVLGRSGRLIGTSSIHPGTCKCPWYES